MDIDELRRYLDDPTAAAEWLGRWKLADPRRGRASLVRMATAGVTLDLLAAIVDQLGRRLPFCPDPDMALNNLDRFVAAARNPLSLGTLFERDPEALSTLVQIFSTSQYLSDLLVQDPESLDLLRLTEGQPIARQALVDEIVAEVDALQHDATVLAALRRFKRRETLRISYGDIIRRQALETVTRQISFLADAIVEAALRSAWRTVAQRTGNPSGPTGEAASMVVLGLGKLGGEELNYSSDIDLVLLYSGEGHTDGRKAIGNAEFFQLVAREMVRLLTETSYLGAAYRVDLRLRPEGQRGAMVVGVDSALAYYEARGRTWERQAFIKARPVAGDLVLGRHFLERMAPWIYRRYLTRADISGIQALKRRIERRNRREGGAARDVKTGHGGIRDVEFAIQFLQLLNGADLPQLRTGNTLEAIGQLERVGCLSSQERSLLTENYVFLRRIEHHLQIMFDLQTHVMPEGAVELRKLALRMGYVERAGRPALAAFEGDYRQRTAMNRRILDHLLHDAFRDGAEVEAEVDLILDPDPPEERVFEVLGKYGFADVRQAYRNLMALSEEKIRFLSTRRCRHFLAAIAPQLLGAIAATPDPDATLVNLDQVSASLGGKGVLWELFSSNPPSLQLYVRLCAYSPFLCSILTSNPGMIDGLMDSLVLDKLPTPEALRNTLADLVRAAEDFTPILHSFKNDQQLRVGVRDILGKEDVQATTAALSAIAETCLAEIAHHEHRRLAAKFGTPRVGEGLRRGEPCEMAILAMGKLGGREMNYHSDLDIVFLYEVEGHTAATGRGERTTNQHFFSELGQRIIQSTSRLGPSGRLYEVDARLRPTGRSGSLAVSLGEFSRYFAEGDGQLWERQALCKSRVVFGSDGVAEAAATAVARAAFSHRWRRNDAEAICHMRHRLEQAAPPGDVKRGEGGIVDIEFVVQMLQLKHGRSQPAVRNPNTLAALDALHEAGCLTAADWRHFTESYRFLRTLEGRLRLISTTARDRLPEAPTELARLAHLMHLADGSQLIEACARHTAENRRRFARLFDQEGDARQSSRA